MSPGSIKFYTGAACLASVISIAPLIVPDDSKTATLTDLDVSKVESRLQSLHDEVTRIREQVVTAQATKGLIPLGGVGQQPFPATQVDVDALRAQALGQAREIEGLRREIALLRTAAENRTRISASSPDLQSMERRHGELGTVVRRLEAQISELQRRLSP
jgi:hypothetical protein